MVENQKIGLVLPAGGARAAYQVGVLRYVGETFPEFLPKIYTGISAGSINASFLAQGKPFPEGAKELFDLWAGLEFDQVMRTNFRSLFRMFLRWGYDLFLSKISDRLLLKSLLDASPLSETLLKNIHFWRISRALREETIDGVAISATNYHDGSTVVFFDSSHVVPEWHAERRKAVRTGIRIRHVMASCSIPILFEPIRIGDYLYGDGSLRFSFPLSPAIHLGATHIFAIGTRCSHPRNVIAYHSNRVGLGFVAGAVLNSIFLDSIESDYENLCRLNRVQREMNLTLQTSPRLAEPERSGMKYIPIFLMRPSIDLGSLASPHFQEIPFHFRQLLKSTAAAAQLGDLLSYLLFSPGYVRELMELGRRDAESQRNEIAQFLQEDPNHTVGVLKMSHRS